MNARADLFANWHEVMKIRAKYTAVGNTCAQANNPFEYLETLVCMRFLVYSEAGHALLVLVLLCKLFPCPIACVYVLYVLYVHVGVVCVIGGICDVYALDTRMQFHRPSQKRVASSASTGRKSTLELGEQRSRPADDLHFQRSKIPVSCVRRFFAGRWNTSEPGEQRSRAFGWFHIQTGRMPGTTHTEKSI